jgi:hypothetical protein
LSVDYIPLKLQRFASKTFFHPQLKSGPTAKVSVRLYIKTEKDPAFETSQVYRNKQQTKLKNKTL